MKTLSIRQPWADLIIRGIKDVENRTWTTTYRGPLLIHASKGFVPGHAVRLYGPQHEWEQGGIVGMVDLVDVVRDSTSPWAQQTKDIWHWLLANPRRVAFTPTAGKLNLYDEPWPSALPPATPRRRDERPVTSETALALRQPPSAVAYVARSLSPLRLQEVAEHLGDEATGPHEQAIQAFVDAFDGSFVSVASALTLDELNRLLQTLGAAPQRRENNAIQLLLDTIATDDDVVDDVISEEDDVDFAEAVAASILEVDPDDEADEADEAEADEEILRSPTRRAPRAVVPPDRHRPH